MPYIKNSYSAVNSSSHTIAYDASENDYLILSTTSYYGSDPATPSGWTKLSYTATFQNGRNNHIFHKRVGAGDSGTVTVSSSVSGFDVQLNVFRGVHTTTAFDVTPVSRASASTDKGTAPGLTPATAGVLLFYVNFPHSINMVPEPGLMEVLRSGGEGGTINTYYTYGGEASVAIPSHEFLYGPDSNFDPTIVVFALRDDGNGHSKGHVKVSSPPCDVVHLCADQGGTGHLTGLATKDITSDVATLDGKSTTYASNLGTELQVEKNFTAFSYGVTWASADCFLACSTLATAINLESDIISFTTAGSPDLYSAYDDMAKHFILGDGTNFRVWKVDAEDSVPSGAEQPLPIVIEVDGGFEERDVGAVSSGVLQSLDHVAFAGPGTTTYRSNGIGFVYRLNTMVILGGSTTFPTSMLVGVDCARTSSLRTVSSQNQQSATQFFCAQKIQVGDGSVATIWDSSQHAMEWPSAYDEANRRVQIQVAAGTLGFVFHASDNCDFNFSSDTFNLGNHHVWELASGTSTSATYNETGATIINGDVTLQDIGRAFAGMTFDSCKEITLNAADLSGGNTIKNSADIYAVTVTNATEFARLNNCTFSGNDRAIRITGDQSGAWADPSLTVSNNNYDIEYTGSTNFTILSETPLTVLNSGSGVLTVDSAVSVKVVVKDSSDSSVIQNARVYLVADAGGDLVEDTVIISALTDANGEAENAAFNFTNNQPVKGTVRKATNSPLYIPAPISGTITANGLEVTTFLTSDE